MQRFTRLDGLRGGLACYVMLGHALPLTVLPWWVLAPFRHGEAAVDLFFCLSGLVIGQSLERYGGDFWGFIGARARRLLPVYVLVLGVATALLALGNPLPAMPWAGVAARDIMPAGLPPHLAWHVAAHLLLLQGLIPQGALAYAYVTLLGPAWSLSTEWQFYLLIALVPQLRLSAFALGLLGLGAAYQSVGLPGWWQFSRAFLPAAAPYFALGLASAAPLQGGGRKFFMFCLSATMLLVLPGGLGKCLIPLGWAGVLAAAGRPWGRVLDGRTLQFLGAISYPLYLVNEPAQRAAALLAAPLAHGRGGVFSALFLPLSLALALAAAAGLHFFVERKFMQQNKKKLLPVIAGPVRQ
jgi:peptidoglycan/LPS O-acetylase OafA/YrhL